MELVKACCLIIFILSTVFGDEAGNDTASTLHGTSLPTPVHSMHRLIPAVIDTSSTPSNFTPNQVSPDNTTHTTPFLPLGVESFNRNSELYQVENKNNATKSNFTPSYFIGEVIPEPYIPERLQNSRIGGLRKNSSIRSHQNPMASQTAFSFHKILPFIEQMKQQIGAAHNGDVADHKYAFHEHVAPVHEPSVEEEESTTPKYSINYEDNDQHSDRPYKFYGEQKNLHSTKPIAFEDHFQNGHTGHENQKEHFHHHATNENDGNYGYGDPYSSDSDFYKGHGDPYLSQPYHPKPHKNDYNGLSNYYKDDLQVGDYLNPQNHHHEADFVLPSPFYPPENDFHPSPHHHHKDVHYKAYHQKPKSALHGLLHFAAALLPLGLLVAALQPNIIHVNDSQPMMPVKQRSDDEPTPPLPGLEIMNALGLGRSDCERRAFCELAVLGGQPGASLAHRGLWKLAHSISQEYAASLGLMEVLKAVKSNSCVSVKCKNSDVEPSSSTLKSRM